MPEDWLAAPYPHFLAMRGQIGEVWKRELDALWSGFAVAFHNPGGLGGIWRDEPDGVGEARPEPSEPSEKDDFYRSEAMRLFGIINAAPPGGGTR